MTHILTTFLRGLSVVLPLVLTTWLVVWLAQGAEALLSEVFVFFLPERFYVTGLGVALGAVFIYAAGILVRVVIVRQLWEWLERSLTNIPLIRSIYNGLRDFLGFLSGSLNDEESRVVTVDMGDGARLIGFVTAEGPRAATPLGELIAVYLPMSYMVGGYTFLVPRTRVAELDWSAEEAMRFVLTAGIGKQVGEMGSDPNSAASS